MPLQTVHIRINDGATGQPTPVRLCVTDSAGNYFAPFGHAAEFPAGRGEAVGGDVIIAGQRWAAIDGSCEIALPPGELVVEATKGPAYRPIREAVHLPLGKMSLRFQIERISDARTDNWHSGDLRAHFLSPHDALLEAAAEDLDVVHILAAATPMHAADGQTYVTFPNLDAFSGQQPALERDGRLVIVGTHNVHPVLGSLALLHCHRVVYPLTFGGSDSTDDWSLGDWCDQCHRKRGLVVWTNAAPTPLLAGAEALAQAILGRVDALEIAPDWPENLAVYNLLLGVGVRLPLEGASAKRSNAVALGACRTHAKLNPGEPLTPATWIEAIRAGRTVVSDGPRLPFTVDGEPPGSTLERVAGQSLQIRSDDRAEIVWNGEVVGRGNLEIAVSTSGWLAARICSGTFAHSSPV